MGLITSHGVVLKLTLLCCERAYMPPFVAMGSITENSRHLKVGHQIDDITRSCVISSRIVLHEQIHTHTHIHSTCMHVYI